MTDERLLRLATFASSAVDARAGLLAWISAAFGYRPWHRRPTARDRDLAGAAASLVMIQDDDRRRIEQLERRLAETQLFTLQLTGMVADLTRIAASQARHLDLHDRVLAPPGAKGGGKPRTVAQ